MDTFSSQLLSNQDFLVQRVLNYARLHDYTRYTSTLEEAWRVSINGLSQALLDAVQLHADPPELEAEYEYQNDSITGFAILEAQRHRVRGVSLTLFLGLMKYYRQAYLDLADKLGEGSHPNQVPLFINRFFDRIEIAFCSEWANIRESDLITELQATNRDMTNEKNKYLTIFESIPTPVVILNAGHKINNMNMAAVEFLTGVTLNPGTSYYSPAYQIVSMNEMLPWLVKEFQTFVESEQIEITLDKDVVLLGRGCRHLVVKFHRMLDVSNKFRGTVIIFTDMTERKLTEEKLRYLSFHDNLTGLYNRVYFEQELIRMESDRFNPIGIVVCDVDGLKVINDNLGHQAGDLLLVTVGSVLKKCFRDSDVVARIGGDEFAAILPGSDEGIVQMVCERVRHELAAHNDNKPNIPVSLSVGCAVGEARETGINQLFKLADDNMYKEKPANRAAYSLLYKEARDKYGDRFFKE